MEVSSDWTCPICGQSREDVAYVTPCSHQLCYGCAFWWAMKKPTCAVCGHKTKTIRYSVRSDDDYMECPVPQPAGHSGSGLQGEQGPAEPVLLAPEHSFPPEVWAAFFEQHPQDLEPLFQWLQEEIETTISGSEWWEVFARQCTVVGFLCTYGLNQVALLRVLQPLTKEHTAPFVRRLITTAAALYGPEIRRQQDHSAGGQEDRAAAARSTTTSHQGPPASRPGRCASPAGLSNAELPGTLREGPGHPTTNAVSSEEPREEQEQMEAAGPSTRHKKPSARGRERLPGGPRRPLKRKARSSPRDSSPPRKRGPRRQH